MKVFLRWSAFLLFITLITGACSIPWKKNNNSFVEPEQNNNINSDDEKIVFSDRLKKFKDQEDLKSFLIANKGKNIINLSSQIASSSIENNFLEYYQENNSHNSLKSDFLKKKDGLAFFLNKNNLQVISLDENSPTILKEINLDYQAEGIFLADKFLAVHGNRLTNSSNDNKLNQIIEIFDISQVNSPRSVKKYSFVGEFSGAFVKDGYLYFLSESSPSFSDDTNFLPEIFENDNLISQDCNQTNKCFSPNVFYFDSIYDSYKFLSINVFSLTNPNDSLSGQIYVLNNNQSAYTSGLSIFITHFKKPLRENFEKEAQKEIILPKLSEGDRKKVEDVEALDVFLLSDLEKQERISLIFNSFLESLEFGEKVLLEADISDRVKNLLEKSGLSSEKTIIHKFSVDGEKIKYHAFSEINGLFSGQESLVDTGERIYLSSSLPRFDEDGKALSDYNNIFIFNRDLVLMGKMERLTTKDEISSIRFIGKRAFLVSSEKEGSLFVIDISDEEKPVFAGTLKMPGQENYLRALDNEGNIFIGLSYYLKEKENSSEKEKKLKLSLFDFSDLKTPKELDSYIIGEDNSGSFSFIDPQSFFFSSLEKIISFPVFSKEGDRLYFSGFFAFNYKGDVLEFLGRADHSAGGFFNQENKINGLSYFENTVRRMLTHNNRLLSFSDKKMLSATFLDIESSLELSLSVNPDDLLISSGRENNSNENQTENFFDDTYQETPIFIEDNFEADMVDIFELTPWPEEVVNESLDVIESENNQEEYAGELIDNSWINDELPESGL